MRRIPELEGRGVAQLSIPCWNCILCSPGGGRPATPRGIDLPFCLRSASRSWSAPIVSSSPPLFDRILFPCSCSPLALILSPQPGVNSLPPPTPSLSLEAFSSYKAQLPWPPYLWCLLPNTQSLNFPLCSHMPLSQLQSTFLAFLLAVDMPALLIVGKVDLATA